MRAPLVLATATLTSGLLAVALPLTANADQARPVLTSKLGGGATPVHAPSVTVHKAGTSTTIGQTGVGACSPGNLSALQSTTAGPPLYTTPAGVITSFSYQGNATPGQVQAVLYGPETSPGNRTVIAKSAKMLSVQNVLNTFPTRVPVGAGLTLGLWMGTSGMSCDFPSGAGDSVHAAIVDPDVTSAFLTVATGAALRVNISAVVESDADGDGYGDVTQDLCPESRVSQVACPMPDTKVKKKPKKASTQPKPKITFSSTIAGSTFTCKVDKKAAKPCTSPFKKKFKVGKHKVVITAVSPAGIADPTPVTVKFRITKPTR
jgi:hypothetical protein